VLRIGISILAVLATCDHPFTSKRQVLTFHTKAWLSPKLIPQEGSPPGSDII